MNACANGNLEILKALYEKVLEKHGKEKADYMMNKANGAGKTPLMEVCSVNAGEAVKVSVFYDLSFPSFL